MVGDFLENLKQGPIRVRGLAKTGIMVIFAVAATNMRLINEYTPKIKMVKRAGRKPIVGIKAHHPIESKRILLVRIE